MNLTSVSNASRWIGASACAAVLGLAVVGCGGDKGADKPASQTAAKVNKEEITVHQINFMLQQQQAQQQRAIPASQTDAASKAALERLIDQELAVQKAGELKVDRDARVVQQIEAARREIISRAYVQKISEGAGKPTPEEIKKYYDDNPHLFSQRRLYQLQEIGIEVAPDKVAALGEKLKASKNTGEFIEYLKAENIKHAVNQGVRGAEQLPMTSLPAFAAMKDGDARISTTPTGAQVLALVGSRSQPVDLERARPVIETFLLNERKRKIIADDMKAMRAAAAIQYVGKYAEGAPGAPDAATAAQATAPAAAPTAVLDPPAAAASSAMDSATITKGLGLK
jgi:EpsD family peptidyl-prolyl cis-trans isomerase